MRPIALCCLLAACEIVPAASLHGPRPSWSNESEAERAATYRKYRLEAQPVGLGVRFARDDDGAHNYMELREVLAEYPKSRALYDKVRVRDNALATLMIVGLSVLVTGGVDQLQAAGGPAALDQTGRNFMYGTGGALLLGALVTSLVWPNPIDQIPATYNAELAADLGLSPADVAASGR